MDSNLRKSPDSECVAVPISLGNSDCQWAAPAICHGTLDWRPSVPSTGRSQPLRRKRDSRSTVLPSRRPCPCPNRSVWWPSRPVSFPLRFPAIRPVGLCLRPQFARVHLRPSRAVSVRRDRQSFPVRPSRTVLCRWDRQFGRADWRLAWNRSATNLRWRRDDRLWWCTCCRAERLACTNVVSCLWTVPPNGLYKKKGRVINLLLIKPKCTTYFGLRQCFSSIVPFRGFLCWKMKCNLMSLPHLSGPNIIVYGDLSSNCSCFKW